MISLDIELQSLKENLIELQEETTSQLIKCRKAVFQGDTALAKEIVDAEKRVNALELMIDKECENILALNHPVATDLRFVIAALKISNDLERIGDNAKGIARVLIDDNTIFRDPVMEAFKLDEMFEVSIEMLSEMGKALEKGDTKLAKKILEKDDQLDKINKQAINVASDLIKDNPKKVKDILNLFAVIRKLERVGDLTKNVGEELIFHVEAKVVKHKKSKKDKK